MSEFNRGTVSVWSPTIIGIIIVLLIGGGFLAWQFGWIPGEEIEVPKEEEKEEVKEEEKEEMEENQTVQLEIEVFSPKGGEIWKKGNTYQIKWRPPKDTEVVNISLYNEVVRAFYEKIAEEHPNTGTFEWTIGQDLLLPQPYGYIVEVTGCHYSEQLKRSVCGGLGDPRGRSEVFSITEK